MKFCDNRTIVQLQGLLMKLSPESVHLFTRKVFKVYGQTTEVLDDSLSFYGSDIFTSWIQLEGTGVWTVLVTYSKELAAEIAHNMYKDDLDEITTDLVMDVAGEMTNILAGHLKVLMDPLAATSPPSVEENVEYEDLFPEANPVVELNLTCQGNPCKVVVIEG